MKTSYFAKYKNDDGVSIAIKSPTWFIGDSYPDLFPRWSFLQQYFKDHDEDAYVVAYYDQILSKLDPNKVFTDLKDKTLLCWEKSGEFCHRRIVAEWLRINLGISVPEV